MSALHEWPLTRGSRILFVPHGETPGLFAADHMTRGDDSCARITDGLPLEEAEAAAEVWLRQTGYRRLVLIDGGRI